MSRFKNYDLSQKVADWEDCSVCNTKGTIFGKDCWNCDGYGYVLVERNSYNSN